MRKSGRMQLRRRHRRAQDCTRRRNHKGGVMSAISLVTPTYWRDYDLCALLCESVDRYLTSYVKHYLIVADEELPLFNHFNGARRVVVPTSQLLPAWLKPLPRFVQCKGR